MIQHLGVDGQSSDESDGEDLLVSHQEWRSDQITQLLELCDESRPSTTELGTRRPGAKPRERIREDNPQPSRRVPKPGLPINFYNPLWYASLGEGTTAQLDIDAQLAMRLPVVVTERRQ